MYKYYAHGFAKRMCQYGHTNIINIQIVSVAMAAYLEERLNYHVEKRHSRQTMETILSAMAKLEYAINHYTMLHCLDVPRLETQKLRMEFYARCKKLLRKSSRTFSNRAYPDPIRLILNIVNGTHQLQASLQYEGGLRTEGVGAPSRSSLKNPLTKEGLRGIGIDPVTRQPIGIVITKEKGGKKSEHYISTETYSRLEDYLELHGKLESNYDDYVGAINLAAQATGQYILGKGSHAFKHNFSQERYLQCIDHGLSHEQALQQVSLETSHFRLHETLTYTRGRG